MRQIDRSVVQAVLAVLVVSGAFLLIAFGREGHVPTDGLFGLVGLVVGYYFGFAVHKPDGEGDS